MVANGRLRAKDGVHGNLRGSPGRIVAESDIGQILGNVARAPLPQPYWAAGLRLAGECEVAGFHPQVAAVNGDGTSPMSNEASVKPVAVATDVTSQVKITSTSFQYKPSTKTYNRPVTVQNRTQQSIAGLLQLALTNLPAGVTLSNATGTTGGSPYITITNQALAAGRSVSVTIKIQALSAGEISYTPVVYSGSF